MRIVWFPVYEGIDYVNSVNQLIVMVTACVLFEVRTAFFNIIETNFCFDELSCKSKSLDAYLYSIGGTLVTGSISITLLPQLILIPQLHSFKQL
jgi:hypothetical protein